MQPSTLLTIAAFPALFAAVMATGQCKETASTADIPCSTVTSAGLTEIAKCTVFEPDCISAFAAALTATPVTAANAATDHEKVAQIFSRKPEDAMKTAKLFTHFKTRIGSFKGGAANTAAADAALFSGLNVAEFDQVDKSVIEAINQATFATLTPADFKNMSNVTAGKITKEQWPKLTKDQADNFGADKPKDPKGDDLKTAQGISACKVVDDAKYALIAEEKAKEALKKRCAWVNSASAVSVTLFLTVASLASVFLMNTLAF